MMRSYIYSLSLSLFLIMGVAIGCQQEQPPSQEDNKIALQLEDSTDYYHYDIQFPKVIRSNDPIKEELQQYAHELTQEFVSFFEQDSIPESITYPWQLSLDFTVEDSTDLFISILGQGYTYTGGAHGNHFYKTVNYSPPSKQVIRLEDLFSDSTALQPISEYSRQAIEEELKQRTSSAHNRSSADQSLSEGSIDWRIKDGTAPDFDLFQHFVFTKPQDGRPAGLTFFFPPYQVAAYAHGPFEVFVPVSVFEDRLQPEAPKLF